MGKSAEDDSWTYIPSRGGFKAAIDSIEQSNNAVQWVSWPGIVVDEASQDGVRRKLEVGSFLTYFQIISGSIMTIERVQLQTSVSLE